MLTLKEGNQITLQDPWASKPHGPIIWETTDRTVLEVRPRSAQAEVHAATIGTAEVHATAMVSAGATQTVTLQVRVISGDIWGGEIAVPSSAPAPESQIAPV